MSVVWKKRLLLGPGDVRASREGWEVLGVFNPGAAWVGGEVVLLVRVAECPRERRAGYVALPRWDAVHGPVIDWAAETDIEPIDPRVVRLKSTGLVRLTFVSHFQVLRSRDPWSFDTVGTARWEPDAEWEEYGVEDPRITRIGDCYWITYVAVSRHGVATALASTADFRSFRRHGIIFPPENKDVVLFPERIGGEFVALHRPHGATRFARPAMWLARSGDLLQWGRHQPLFGGRADWESGRVGAGPPPLRVPQGWLAIYHGNCRPARPGEVGRYQAGAMLLGADNPAQIVQCTAEPILTPTEPFERQGFVGEVVFPTGILDAGDAFLVYCGASDTHTMVAEATRREVMDHLRLVA